MSTRGERDRSKAQQERHQMILSQLLKDEDNKYCVDCDAKGPRWASHNLGIFMCIRCAGIHRNLGVHISKVKSVNLDTWTNDQVAMMQEIGNSRARAVYEANIPDHFRRPQTDSSLEAFIRAKYEQKKYQAHGWVPPKPSLQLPPEEPKKEKKKPRPRPASTNVKLTSATPETKPSPVQSTDSFASPGSASWPEIAETQKEKPESNIDDLLGLDTNCAGSPNGGDLFSDFMSAPSSDVNTQANTVSTSNTDVSTDNVQASSQPLSGLFDQGDSESAEQAKEPQKSTKESIMSLFGPSTNQNVGYNMQMPQQGMPQQGGMMMGMPGMQNGMMVNGMQQCYPGMQQQPVNMMQTGQQQAAMMGMQMQGQMQGGGMQQQQQAGMVASQPAMYNMNMYGMQQQQMSQVQGGLSNLQLGGAPLGGGFGSAASGSGFSSQPGLMSNGWSSSAGQMAPSSGHTLSTNLWQ